MDFLFNLLLGFILSAIISIIIYFANDAYIVSKGNESKILKFYEKDIKSYKTLEKFFKSRRSVQKPLVFMLMGALLGTVTYFIGLFVLIGFVTYILGRPKSASSEDDFSIVAYVLGFILFQSSTVRLFIKAKELMEHFEKFGKKKAH